MATRTQSHDDLFAALDSALTAVEFAHITGEADLAEAAEHEVREATATALARGYILDALNCEIGHEVQNLHGDTGVITSIRASHQSPRIEVRWDAPSPHATTFTAATLLAGHLRHRR